MDNVTDRELQGLFTKCKVLTEGATDIDVSNLNISIKFNRRKGMIRMGMCTRRETSCEIDITESYVNHPDVTQHEVEDTIIHELIHCLPGANNHGPWFKLYADKVNRTYGYSIS